jgi:hypothetical protein
MLEISKQLDVPDANQALQGLGLYGWRRVRQVRRVEGSIYPWSYPRGVGPFA